MRKLRHRRRACRAVAAVAVASVCTQSAIFTSAALVCVENQAPTVPNAADMFTRGALSKYGSRHTYLMNDGAGQEVCDQDDGVFHLALLPPYTNQAEETCQGLNNCIIVGDKTCAFEVNVDAQIIFRQYGDALMYSAPGLPLGPMATFEWVPPEERVAGPRRFLFNFKGNVAGRLRGSTALLETVGSQGWGDDSEELQVLWHPTVATSESEYRDALLQSSFTLCPLGPAQDSYRFWEAIEAGSIPVVLRQDRRSRQATCPAPFADVLATTPPIVLMDSWDDLPIYMESMTMNDIATRQKALAQWNEDFWKKLVESLDSAVVQYGSPFGNSGDSAADAEKIQHFAEIAAGYAMAKGKEVQSTVQLSYNTLLHTDDVCKPPSVSSADDDAGAFLQSVQDCILHLLTPD